MAEAALVEQDIEAGREFVELLDSIGLPVEGAFWLYRSDSDRWSLTIVTPDAVGGTRKLYERAISAKPSIDLSRVEFVTPNEKVFLALSHLVHPEGGEAVRLSQNFFDGVYVEDAVVYRVAA